jgi:RHS repeat-associated protein
MHRHGQSASAEAERDTAAGRLGVPHYAYPEAGLPRPHAVTSVAGGTVSATFSYDANGNQTAGLGRAVTYTSYNKPATIAQGTLTLSFADDVDHQRFKQTMLVGSTTTTTRYLDAFGVHAELVSATSSQWNDYLMVGGSMVGLHVLRSDQSVSVRYFHQDHLGSIAVLTDEAGHVAEPDSYDAWGKRRFLNGSDDPTGSIVSQTSRGFTGEEMLASVGLVHLNGRVYDPFIGRMLSADPVVGDPMNGQSWNRYSYVYNNPLAYTDPTGYCTVCFGEFFSRVATGISKFLQRNPLAGTVLQIAAVALCQGNLQCAGIAATVSSFVVTGLTTGRLDSALLSAAISAYTAAAFYAVGDITNQFLTVLPDGTRAAMQFGDQAHLVNIVGHALVGSGAAVASGGQCGTGALSAAAPAIAGPIISKLNFETGLVGSSTLGGLASVAGGGKFANGAITGVFGYLFNYRGHSATSPNGATGGEQWQPEPDGTQVAGPPQYPQPHDRIPGGPWT